MRRLTTHEWEAERDEREKGFRIRTRKKQRKKLHNLNEVYWQTFQHFKSHIDFVRDTQDEEDVDYVFDNLMECDTNMKVIRTELRENDHDRPMEYYDYDDYYDRAQHHLHLATTAIKKMKLPEWIIEN